MQVRKATIDDLPYLFRFTKEEAELAEGIQLVPEQLEKGIKEALSDSAKAIYWVLVDDKDIPVGSISVFLEWSDWRGGNYWWIQSLFLTSSQRGKGFVSMLVDEVKKEMEKQSGLELRLYVHESNKSAIRAYEKMGFTNLDYQIMKLG